MDVPSFWFPLVLEISLKSAWPLLQCWLHLPLTERELHILGLCYIPLLTTYCLGKGLPGALDLYENLCQVGSLVSGPQGVFSVVTLLCVSRKKILLLGPNLEREEKSSYITFILLHHSIPSPKTHNSLPNSLN